MSNYETVTQSDAARGRSRPQIITVRAAQLREVSIVAVDDVSRFGVRDANTVAFQTEPEHRTQPLHAFRRFETSGVTNAGWRIDRNAGGLSRQQGGPEHVHAKLHSSAIRHSTRNGSHGSRLGPH